jgi:uncharacterized protein YjbJ (UPF0337 family)
MNKDVFEGKWEQIRDEVKGWWDKLTDDEIDRTDGKYDVFTSLLQEKYGYTHEAAVDEIDKHMTEYEANMKEDTTPAHR